MIFTFFTDITGALTMEPILEMLTHLRTLTHFQVVYGSEVFPAGAGDDDEAGTDIQARERRHGKPGRVKFNLIFGGYRIYL